MNKRNTYRTSHLIDWSLLRFRNNCDGFYLNYIMAVLCNSDIVTIAVFID